MENFYVLQFLRENVVFGLVWLFGRHDAWQGCDLGYIHGLSEAWSYFWKLKDSTGVDQGPVARYTLGCTPSIALGYTKQPALVNSLLITSFSSICHKSMTRIT